MGTANLQEPPTPRTEVHDDREIMEPCQQTLCKYYSFSAGTLKKCHQIWSPFPTGPELTAFVSAHTVHPLESELAPELAHLSV